jgi:pimeloyl-ACP methyl ester carboxylesterase
MASPYRIWPWLAGMVTLVAVTPLAQAAPSACEASGTPERALVSESYRIASDTPGIELYVRNKRPAQAKGFPSERILLYVHGATYPSETAFDLPLGGFSWMDYIACRGFDVYLVDLRGYGQSTRPPEMDRPAADHAPIVTTDVAVRDVGAAVDHILARRAVKKINLLGWSWGTAIMASYTAQNSGKVNRLTLYAPLWLRNTPPLIGGDGPLGAYRTVTKESARKRWYTNVPEAKQKDLIPAGWFEAWADATWATDPASAQSGLLRAPNGVVQDVREYWAAGKPAYDPGRIDVPVLLAHAEWDADTPSYMAQALFGLLVNAPWKRMVEIGEGTHTVIMERNRLQLFREVQLFLEE